MLHINNYMVHSHVWAAELFTWSKVHDYHHKSTSLDPIWSHFNPCDSSKDFSKNHFTITLPSILYLINGLNPSRLSNLNFVCISCSYRVCFMPCLIILPFITLTVILKDQKYEASHNFHYSLLLIYIMMLWQLSIDNRMFLRDGLGSIWKKAVVTYLPCRTRKAQKSHSE